MPVFIALTIGLIFLVCGYALGLGSLVSAVCAVTILFVGIAIHVLAPGRSGEDEGPADAGRAIN